MYVRCTYRADSPNFQTANDIRPGYSVADAVHSTLDIQLFGEKQEAAKQRPPQLSYLLAEVARFSISTDPDRDSGIHL